MRAMLFPLCLLLIAGTSCKKKDAGEPEPGYQIVYDGVQYTVKNGLIWDYGEDRHPSYWTYAYFLLDGGEFQPDGNYDLAPGDPPISVFYFLSSPGTAVFLPGTFEFVDLSDTQWWNGLPSELNQKYFASFAVVGFDANGDRTISPEEVLDVTGGTIKVDVVIGYTEYNLVLENGKTLTGRAPAAYSKQQPPA